MLVVTMPKTAANINETRNKSAKNGVMKMVKRESRMKSEGRRTNQPNRKRTRSAKLYILPKTFCNHFSTKLVTADVSL